MRGLLTIVLAVSTAAAQPDPAPTLDSLLAAAKDAQARSDPRAAAKAYREAVALRPDIAELWSNLGLMQHESGEYAQAVEAFRRALRLNRVLFVPNLFLGLDLLQLKRPREALPYLLASEKLQPADPQPALALGRAFHMLSQPDKSREWYQRAVALAPREGGAWYGLGLAHLGLAEAAGAKLTGSFPDSAHVAELAANAFAEQGRLPEAITAYRRLFASTKAPPRCSHASYGFALLRHADSGAAEQEFRRESSSCPAARIGMARLLFESGARDQALVALADLASSKQDEFDAALPRFWEGLDARQLETRVALLQQSTATIARTVESHLREGVRSTAVLEPDSPIPQSGGAADLEKFASDAFFSGHFRLAALTSDRLRQSNPNNPSGWYWAVRANQKLGVAALARAGEVEPDSPRMHALLGDVYQRRKMYDEAREEYSKMLVISPGNVAGLAGLAAADLADGKLEQAQAEAQQALARSPDDSEINLLMGDILVAQHQYAEAEPYLQRGLYARPDLLPRVHALLGRVFARTGRPKLAIQELKQGLPSDEDGTVYYQLARLYQESGDTKAAAAAFEKSKQIRSRRNALAQEALQPVR